MAGIQGLKRTRLKVEPGAVIAFLLLLLVSLAMLLPVVWMLTTALKGNEAIFVNPPQWIPKAWHWENFVKGMDAIGFFKLLKNSLVVAVPATILQSLTSAYVAYGLSRINFPGRDLWFYLFIGSMMLPPIVSMIPVFRMMLKLHWLDTYWPLWVPPAFGNPFFIFLAKQYYHSIPKSLDEAAKIDGGGHWTIFFRIILPLSTPVLMTMFLMSFLGVWNDYLNPLIYIIDSGKWTLALGIASLSSAYGVRWNYLMAVDLLYMLPPILLFFAAQKYFMQGLGSLATGSIK